MFEIETTELSGEVRTISGGD